MTSMAASIFIQRRVYALTCRPASADYYFTA